jgi:hypothetical protein
MPCVTQNQNIFFYERARNRSRKDREREDTDFAQYSRKQEYCATKSPSIQGQEMEWHTVHSRARNRMASYKRACTRREAPEGYHLFRYKDKGTKDIAHMLDLEDYGVTKKWVIITEISKEVENNAIARLSAYAKQYVPRRTGAAGGSSAGGGSSGRS